MADGEAEALGSIESKIRELPPAKIQPSIYQVHEGLHHLHGAAFEPNVKVARCEFSVNMADGEAVALKSIERKIFQLSEFPPAKIQHSIYKVHEDLRNVRKKAYEPVILAVGPYHCGKYNLQMMEEHKLRYLKALVKRKPEVKVENCISTVAQIGRAAQDCYAEPIRLSPAKFIEMLVLDGCFIIEFMLRNDRRNSTGTGNDPIFETLWIMTSLKRDLLLFENQIPFFVLCKLFDLIEGPNQHNRLMKLLLMFFENVFPGCVKGKNNSSLGDKVLDLINRAHHFFQSIYPCAVEKKGTIISRKDVKQEHDRSSLDVKHILDLLHGNWSRSTDGKSDTGGEVERNSRTNSNSSDVEHGLDLPHNNWSTCTSDTGGAVLERNKADSTSPESKVITIQLGAAPGGNESDSASLDRKEIKSKTVQGEYRFIRFIPTATELGEANVKFRVSKEAKNLFHIDFDNGTLSMPPLRVEDRTESVFRNLIVYEQYLPKDQPTSFTDYAQLLDCLINSSNDVQILRQCGIIENWLGDNEAIVTIFNQITNSVTLTDKFVYGNTFSQINHHCQRRWNKAIAKLKRNYFNSPWAYISFFAALLLLLLTIAQTVLSALQIG